VIRWLVVLALLAALPARAEERVELPVRQGVTLPLLVTPAANPVGSVLLLPGGTGVVAQVRNNFLIRVAPRFAAAGFTAAIVDVASDHAGGLSPVIRAGAEHAHDLGAAADYLRTRFGKPVWLVGTSNGSVSAANGAAALGPERIKGVVLTSSVWAGRMWLTPIDRIRVPALVVHNRDDGCQESPFAGINEAMKRLAAAPVHELIAVSGGMARGDACGGLSAHGYLGIEDQVVPPIVAWMKGHG
jgi:pimeloyl-ACP methyl ester carboxylesterase